MEYRTSFIECMYGRNVIQLGIIVAYFWLES